MVKYDIKYCNNSFQWRSTTGTLKPFTMVLIFFRINCVEFGAKRLSTLLHLYYLFIHITIVRYNAAGVFLKRFRCVARVYLYNIF